MLRQIFSKRPLFPIVGLVLSGIVISHFYSPNALFIGVFGIVALTLSFCRISKSSFTSLFIAALYLWVGMVLECVNRPAHAGLEQIEGEVVVSVESIKRKKNKYQLTSIWTQDETTYRVLVALKDSCQVKPKPGDVLRLSSRLFIPSTAFEPGGFDYRNYLKNKGIQFVSYPLCQQVQLLSSDRSTFLTFCWKMTNRIVHRIDEVFQNNRTNALVKGILLGQKNDIETEESDMYRSAGIGHVFAVSGMHVGMVYLFFYPLLFFRNYNLVFRWGIPVLVILFVWLFVMTSGLTPSAVRAGLMITLYEGGRLFYRPIDKWNILAFSALLSVLFQPNVIFDIGFQFSYLALSGIFLLFSPLNKLFQPKLAIVRYIYQAIVLSVSAQLILLPLSMYYFGSFSPFFWLSSLVAMMVVQINFILSFLALFLPVESLFSSTLISMVDGLFLILWQSIYEIMEFRFSVLKWTPELMQVLFVYLVYLCATAIWKSKNRMRSLKYCLAGVSLFVGVELGFRFTSTANELVVYGREEVKVDLGRNGTKVALDLSESTSMCINSDVIVQYLGNSSSEISDESRLVILDADQFNPHDLDDKYCLENLIVSANVPYRLSYRIQRFCEENGIAFGDLRRGYQKVEI